MSGTGHPVDDAAVRATVVATASDGPADRYVLFELRPTEVRCNGYGDVTLPERRRWRADPLSLLRPVTPAVPDPPEAGEGEDRGEAQECDADGDRVGGPAQRRETR